MAYSRKNLRKKLKVLIERVVNIGLDGASNYEAGRDAEEYLRRRIERKTRAIALLTAGSRTAFDVVAVENKRDGLVVHFIQCKSSGNGARIENYRRDRHYNKMRGWSDNFLNAFKNDSLTVISSSISWACVHNPEGGRKRLVSLTLIERSKVSTPFYSRLKYEKQKIEIDNKKHHPEET